MKKIISICLIILGCSDDIAPTVEITYPNNNESVSGFITIDVKANDDIELDRVALYIDSEVIEYSYGDYTSHSFTFDTDNYRNGIHDVYAKAYDVADNYKNSEILEVTFLNYINLIINNTTFGDISLQVENQIQIAESGESVVFEVEKNYGNLTFSGQLVNLDCGLNLIWGVDSYIDIENDDVSKNLVVGPERFFLEISNNLSVDISHFKVYENSIDTTNYITCDENIPNNGIFYGKGFYEVRNDLLFRFFLQNHPETSSIHTTAPPTFDNQNNQSIFYNLFGFLSISSNNSSYKFELKEEDNLYPINNAD